MPLELLAASFVAASLVAVLFFFLLKTSDTALPAVFKPETTFCVLVVFFGWVSVEAVFSSPNISLAFLLFPDLLAFFNASALFCVFLRSLSVFAPSFIC